MYYILKWRIKTKRDVTSLKAHDLIIRDLSIFQLRGIQQHLPPFSKQGLLPDYFRITSSTTLNVSSTISLSCPRSWFARGITIYFYAIVPSSNRSSSSCAVSRDSLTKVG